MNLKKFFTAVNTNMNVEFALGDHDDIEHPSLSQPDRVKPAAPKFKMRSS